MIGASFQSRLLALSAVTFFFVVFVSNFYSPATSSAKVSDDSESSVIYLPITYNSSLATSSWVSVYTGLTGDAGNIIRETSDGGYIVAGRTNLNDVWIFKLDEVGTVQWQKRFTSGRLNSISDIRQLDDGSYIASGSIATSSTSYRAWVLKLTANGSVQWQKSYGGSSYLSGGVSSIRQLADGGYIGVGATLPPYGSGTTWDGWIFRLNSNGNIVWQKNIGYFDVYEWDQLDDFAQAADGNYVAVGHTGIFSTNNYDILLVKFSASGTVIWNRTFIGADFSGGTSIKATPDGGFVIATNTQYFGTGDRDVFLLNLDSYGNIRWQKALGGTTTEYVWEVQPTATGYVFAGSTDSFGAGLHDAWIANLDTTGNIIWQKTYGGMQSDGARSIAATTDGGYIVTGTTLSFEPGNTSLWILKLNAEGEVPDCGLVGSSDAAIVATSAGGASGNHQIVQATTSPTNAAIGVFLMTSTSSTICPSDGIMASFCLASPPP